MKDGTTAAVWISDTTAGGTIPAADQQEVMDDFDERVEDGEDFLDFVPTAPDEVIC